MASTGERPTPDGTDAASRSHIVVVNDTEEILDLFREILEGEGYRVSLYSFAFHNVDEIVKLNPDLVILDFMIGGEAQGWQLLQEMKMDRQAAKIPVVVCTAALSLVRQIEGRLREKRVGLVLKPFDIDELIAEVRQRLEDAGASETAIPAP